MENRICCGAQEVIKSSEPTSPYWPKADLGEPLMNVRYSEKSGRDADLARCRSLSPSGIEQESDPVESGLLASFGPPLFNQSGGPL